MTIERACDRSAAPASGQKFAAVSRARRILPSSKCGSPPLHLEQAEPFRGVRIDCIGKVEVAAGIKVIGFMEECNFI
jgi:hypothetical protein